MKKTLTFNELVKAVQGLSLSEMRRLNTVFNKEMKKEMDKRIEKLVIDDLQNRLINLGINQSCPKCGSTLIVKNGFRNQTQRFECKECNHQFTLFSNTFLEKSKQHWDLWIEVVYLMLHHTPLKKMKAILEEEFLVEGITERTLLNWRLKIMSASQVVTPPSLTGVIEVDECYLREGQKGKLELVDPLKPKKNRKARRKKRTSELGVLGPEFSNIVVAIDRSGHVIAKVIGVGACTQEAFEQEFEEHIKHATWLCTDSNGIYTLFTSTNGINHYIRPSYYLDNLYKGKCEEKTEEELYKLGLIDYINTNGRENIPFKEFKKLKDKHKLSLARVNEFHSVLRNHLEVNTHGVSITNLKEYLAWEVLLKNYAVDYGHSPATRKDAEKILEILLQCRTNLKVKEMYNRKADFTSIKKRYVNQLDELTKQIRKKNEQFLHLTPEDIGPNFNVDEYLKTLPIYRLGKIAKLCKVRGFSTMVSKKQSWNLRKSIQASPLCKEAIIQYILDNPTKQDE